MYLGVQRKSYAIQGSQWQRETIQLGKILVRAANKFGVRCQVCQILARKSDVHGGRGVKGTAENQPAGYPRVPSPKDFTKRIQFRFRIIREEQGNFQWNANLICFFQRAMQSSKSNRRK